MTPSSEHALERRYRRLLGWYPAGYRAASAEEMLGVAMARSADGQRWPGPGETASLITGALRTRFSIIPAGIRNQAWQRASAAIVIMGSLLLASQGARELIVAWFRPDGGGYRLAGGGYFSWGAVAECAGWALVATAAVLRWRRMAAIGAVAGFAGEIVRSWRIVYPRMFTDMWPTLVLASAVAVTALIAVRYQGRGLSWRAILSGAAATAVTGAWPLVQVLPGMHDTMYVAFGDAGIALGACALLVVLMVIVRLEPVTRRRVLIGLAPAVTAYAITHWLTSSYWLFSVQPGEMSGRLVPAQWGYYASLPVAVFLAGLIWLARYERTLRRVAQQGVAG